MACSAEEVDKHEAIRGFRGAWRMAWRIGGDKRRGRQCISATHVLRLEQMHFQIEFRLKTRTLKIVNIICLTGKIVCSKNIIPPRLH